MNSEPLKNKLVNNQFQFNKMLYGSPFYKKEKKVHHHFASLLLFLMTSTFLA